MGIRLNFPDHQTKIYDCIVMECLLSPRGFVLIIVSNVSATFYMVPSGLVICVRQMNEDQFHGL